MKRALVEALAKANATAKEGDTVQIPPGLVETIWKSLARKARVSKYAPHQNTRECQRRLRQIKRGTLQGPYVAIEARYHALGLTAPNDIRMIEKLSD